MTQREMLQDDKLKILIETLQKLTTWHDGDCACYPAMAHERPWKESECDCFNHAAREALRKVGIEVPKP